MRSRAGDADTQPATPDNFQLSETNTNLVDPLKPGLSKIQVVVVSLHGSTRYFELLYCDCQYRNIARRT